MLGTDVPIVVDIVLEAGFWLPVVVTCPVVVAVEAERDLNQKVDFTTQTQMHFTTCCSRSERAAFIICL